MLVLWMGGQAWASEPILSGAWRGELGTLRLQTLQGGRISGHYEGGGPCNFLPGQAVLKGELEGRVLVGTLNVCQRGPSCAEKVYGILAFYDAADGTLSGLVRLDEGCASPALQQNRFLTLAPVQGQEASERSTALAVARKNKKLTRRSAQLAEQHFTEGMRLLEAGHYRAARAAYERGLTYHEDNWAAYNLLGVIQMRLDNAPAALQAYRTAAILNPGSPVVTFNTACAHARMKERERALHQLRQAVGYGFGGEANDAAAMSRDPDLAALLGADPEFKALLKQVREQGSKRGGK